jgi:hypothetical protein
MLNISNTGKERPEIWSQSDVHATTKLYQFTEDAVCKILLQRSVMFHICTIVVSTVQVSCLETPGEKKLDKEGKED